MLCQNGKTQSQISKEYGISISTINRWGKLCSTVETDEGEILTVKHVNILRFQHSIKTLCRVLKVNRSTYYKHFSSTESNRFKENKKNQILYPLLTW